MLKRIKELREIAGMSQKALADSIGVSQQSINKYENHNIEPDIETLKQIASLFNTSIDYITEHTDIISRIEKTTPSDLNDAELIIISNYRKLTKTQQSLVAKIILSYLK